MNRIKRYYSALSRYHKSNGYGIHSPFAYHFVLGILRERLPYYAYSEIEKTRRMVISKTRKHGRHPRIISIKNAKLLFRLVNLVNPQHILQFGTSYGVSTSSMLMVSHITQLTLCEPHLSEYNATAKVLKPYMERIALFTDAGASIDDYEKRHNGCNERRFLLVNNVENRDVDIIDAYIHKIMATEGFIVMRNLSRSSAMNGLWNRCKADLKFGMTFSNEKIAVIVINNKLPKQDYFLWF
ncbi:MAG: hypothetical protein RR061_05490 [Muribaculaceae bacterium]